AMDLVEPAFDFPWLPEMVHHMEVAYVVVGMFSFVNPFPSCFPSVLFSPLRKEHPFPFRLSLSSLLLHPYILFLGVKQAFLEARMMGALILLIDPVPYVRSLLPLTWLVMVLVI